MPIYEFQCNDCEGIFEEMRRITDDTLPGCPACQSENVRKLISLSAFHLKGTGWYVTDYGGKKNDAAAEGEEGKGNGSDKPDETGGSEKAPAVSGEKSESSSKSETKAKEPQKEAKPKSSGDSSPSK